jgi:hypothetical protein
MTVSGVAVIEQWCRFAAPHMSAFGGGLKRSTQHFMSDARDGVDRRRVKDMFEGSTRWPRKSCGTAGGAHSQFNRVARQLNERSRETLGFEPRAERDLMLVLHRPIEPTAQSGHSRFKIAAVQLDPEPHFAGQKFLL